jgi:hypothetical protein
MSILKLVINVFLLALLGLVAYGGWHLYWNASDMAFYLYMFPVGLFVALFLGHWAAAVRGDQLRTQAALAAEQELADAGGDVEYDDDTHPYDTDARATQAARVFSRRN